VGTVRVSPLCDRHAAGGLGSGWALGHERARVRDNRHAMGTKEDDPTLTRRRMLQGAGGLIAAAALPSVGTNASGLPLRQVSTPGSSKLATDLTVRVARYMVEARDRNLPPHVAREAKHRILDTLGAMVSGARLKPGEMAIKYARAQGGVPEASVLTTDIRTSAINAALVNGMFGHADETDDFEPITKAHPGCVVVPAALAMAEREGRSGMELLRAVTLGYDLCCRFLMALGPDLVRATHRSAEGTSATFGGAAAAASLARLDEKGMRHALSYAAQQVSGIWSWARDTDHIEKAFDFAGMGARNGVTAAIMVQTGFTGVDDVLDGEHNMLEALSTQPRPQEMVAALGSRFFVTETAIKTFSVGYPIQAALDAFLTLRRESGLTVNNVERIVVKLPEDGARIVDNSPMPDVNCQYLIAVALIDGTVSFADSHSQERMKDAEVRAVKERVQLVADRALMNPDAPRSGMVEVTLRGGRTVSHFTRHPPGTKENPLDTGGVNAKARSLMLPVLGAERTESIIGRVNALEELDDVRNLRPLLTL
jgi:2-methylcitrate dehydratase PrpD